MNDVERRLAGMSPERRALLMRLSAQDRALRDAIAPQPRPQRIPLGSSQRRMWLLDRMHPGNPAYNVPCAWWLHGAAAPQRLRAALQRLIDRHEILRTLYAFDGNAPEQRILPQAVLPWCELEIDGDSIEARREAALDAARRLSSHRFALEDEPPLRALLIRVGPELHLLQLVFHHIAVDGWSVGMLMREFGAEHDAMTHEAEPHDGATHGRAAEPAPPALQMADVALWQRRAYEGEGLRPQLDYWTQRLQDAPLGLDLPADRARAAHEEFAGAQWSGRIPSDLLQAVQAFARERRTTPTAVFLAAWQLLLARRSGQERVVVAMGTAGRERVELETVAGCLVNTLPMDVVIDPDCDAHALVDRVRDGLLDALEHADIPLDRLLETLRTPRSLGHAPFAQAMFFYQNFPEQPLRLQGLRAERLHLAEIRGPWTQADLSLFVAQFGEDDLYIEYSTALYDADTVARIGGHLLQLLREMTASPHTPVWRLPMLTAGEREALARWNDTARPLPAPATIVALVEAQVACTPEAVALRFGDRDIAYAELDRRANALAHALRERGVTSGEPVGLYVERAPEMVVGLLGILKAGAAYVPLDPAYPRERLGYMLETAGVRVVVAQEALRAAVPADGLQTVAVDAARSDPGAFADARPAAEIAEDALAYVIFTSGSTGKPKGVEIAHRAAANLLRSIARAPGLAAGESILAISTLSFDIALTELVLPLTVGARILLADRDTVRDAHALKAMIARDRPDLVQATPATWRMLLEVGWTGREDLRIVSTGEALPGELAERLLPQARELWNLYGPTETTVYSALCRVVPGEGPVLVGRPVDNTVIRIVDRHGQPQPVGVPGELLIGGAGLARGYAGRPDLTAERFVPDPAAMDATDAAALVYRSGDLALWRADGAIQVVGRIDHQIKLRGFRIELGEIESVLCDLPGMRQAVVHCREDRPGERRLVAYYRHDAGARPADALRAHLKAALPDYMVPSAFVAMETFPLTPSGKVDRNALPAPDADTAEARVAPRTEEEHALVVMWRELLQLPEIDVRADFFDLGGHSLLGTRLLARIDREFGVQLPLRALFEASTLERLAARVAGMRDADDDMDAATLERLMEGLDGLDDEEVMRRLAQYGVDAE